MNITETWVNGRRWYSTPFGRVPSVTTILSATKSDRDKAALEKWKENEPDHAQISADARERGKALHKMIEDYMQHDLMGQGRWWASIWPVLQQVDRTKPVSIEQSIASPEGYAGAYDMTGTLDGEETVFDWKTSRKKKRAEWINDYFAQVSAYAAAINMQRLKEGKPLIRQGIVVIAYETGLADEFRMNRDSLIAHYQHFLKRLAQYKRQCG